MWRRCLETFKASMSQQVQEIQFRMNVCPSPRPPRGQHEELGDQSAKAETRERPKLVPYVKSTGYKTASEGLPSPRTGSYKEYGSRRPTYVVGAASQREQIHRNEPAEPEYRLGSMTYAFDIVAPSPRPGRWLADESDQAASRGTATSLHRR